MKCTNLDGLCKFELDKIKETFKNNDEVSVEDVIKYLNTNSQKLRDEYCSTYCKNDDCGLLKIYK